MYCSPQIQWLHSFAFFRVKTFSSSTENIHGPQQKSNLLGMALKSQNDQPSHLSFVDYRPPIPICNQDEEIGSCFVVLTHFYPRSHLHRCSTGGECGHPTTGSLLPAGLPGGNNENWKTNVATTSKLFVLGFEYIANDNVKFTH